MDNSPSSSSAAINAPGGSISGNSTGLWAALIVAAALALWLFTRK